MQIDDLIVTADKETRITISCPADELGLGKDVVDPAS